MSETILGTKISLRVGVEFGNFLEELCKIFKMKKSKEKIPWDFNVK
jgi:hypothetical protein